MDESPLLSQVLKRKKRFLVPSKKRNLQLIKRSPGGDPETETVNDESIPVSQDSNLPNHTVSIENSKMSPSATSKISMVKEKAFNTVPEAYNPIFPTSTESKNNNRTQIQSKPIFNSCSPVIDKSNTGTVIEPSNLKQKKTSINSMSTTKQERYNVDDLNIVVENDKEKVKVNSDRLKEDLNLKINDQPVTDHTAVDNGDIKSNSDSLKEEIIITNPVVEINGRSVTEHITLDNGDMKLNSDGLKEQFSSRSNIIVNSVMEINNQSIAENTDVKSSSTNNRPIVQTIQADSVAFDNEWDEHLFDTPNFDLFSQIPECKENSNSHISEINEDQPIGNSDMLTMRLHKNKIVTEKSPPIKTLKVLKPHCKKKIMDKSNQTKFLEPKLDIKTVNPDMDAENETDWETRDSMHLSDNFIVSEMLNNSHFDIPDFVFTPPSYTKTNYNPNSTHHLNEHRKNNIIANNLKSTSTHPNWTPCDTVCDNIQVENSLSNFDRFNNALNYRSVLQESPHLEEKCPFQNISNDLIVSNKQIVKNNHMNGQTFITDFYKSNLVSMNLNKSKHITDQYENVGQKYFREGDFYRDMTPTRFENVNTYSPLARKVCRAILPENEEPIFLGNSHRESTVFYQGGINNKCLYTEANFEHDSNLYEESMQHPRNLVKNSNKLPVSPPTNISGVLAFTGNDFNDFVKDEETMEKDNNNKKTDSKSKWGQFVNNDLYEPKIMNMRNKWIDNIIKREKEENITEKYLNETTQTQSRSTHFTMDRNKYESMTQPVSYQCRIDQVNSWLEKCSNNSFDHLAHAHK